jgi:hypothetical protein
MRFVQIIEGIDTSGTSVKLYLRIHGAAYPKTVVSNDISSSLLQSLNMCFHSANTADKVAGCSEARALSACTLDHWFASCLLHVPKTILCYVCCLITS